ncbi:hypothetical protein Tph_c21760 [Thermacetogenium phaeum DSM 12270]|uniref:IstB-like ATP-binding domain-containing protein n=1 Tax=Thermacetogenium phaeum (strain ATCC BAA-254 / DSM 26808 / PB) TaxID=1089553 RepID=K4LWK1_THEPS|nr:ATP-binding protein [Thermacetogenium phaeum]AFV12369.1 hypothetical protein Tph_c21760 [Thermacetogenium phaeum DSM 12270]
MEQQALTALPKYRMYYEVTPREELIKLYAKQLKISTFSQYKELIHEAQQDGWCYEEFLYQLMKTEVEKRQQNQLKWRIKAASFPVIKTLDTFETTIQAHCVADGEGKHHH